MDLDQLNTFLAVCREKSVTKAASALSTTPPSVSVKISSLEEELGLVLFRRTPRGMDLTAEGVLLREKAEAALDSVAALERAAALLRQSPRGELTVGLNASPALLRLGPISKGIGRAGEGIGLSWVNSVSGRIIQEIRDGSLDAGFIFGPSPGPDLRVLGLGSINLVVCLPAAWKDRTGRGGWADLARLPWLYSQEYCPFQEMADSLFARRGLDYAKAARADDEATKLELIAAGIGLALVEESEAREAAERTGRVALLPLEPLECSLSLACLGKREAEPLLKILFDEAARVWERG